MAVTKGNKGTISGSVRKRGQGGLTKEERLQSKLDKAEQKMKELEVKLKGELTEASELLVREYVNYIKFLDDVAQGRIKEASVTARIGACDKLIKRVDELREELEMDGVDPDSLSEMEDPLGEESEGSAEGHDENVIQFG